MNTAVIAEKPSVARDIAAVVGATRRGDGCLVGNGYTVSWALGHLVALAEPHEINPAWKAWSAALLPMLPAEWPLTVLEQTRAQYRIVEKILQDPAIDRVICATDAGREGELIFRYVYEKAGCKKPVFRLWISSLTASAIQKGMSNLKSGATFDNLAAAAKGRSRADWLVGMNLSRAYTLSQNETFSVGRVQTPTLAMLVDRTRAIQSFVPESYLEVAATFATSTGGYVGVFYDEKNKTHLPIDGAAAEAILRRAHTGPAEVLGVKNEEKRQPPPLLYDLTELQRHANRLFGFSANKTLQVAQSLYEKHKLISYPRTDSRFLSKDIAENLGEIVAAIRAPFEGKLAPDTGEKPLGGRFVNDARVTDHHAIIPTSLSAENLSRGGDEWKLYDLICRRLLMAWHSDHRTAVTTVTTGIFGLGVEADIVDSYRSSGTLVLQEGWKILDIPFSAKKKTDAGERSKEQEFPPGLTKGDKPKVVKAEMLKKQTEPPRPFTEATLLTAMETAGKTLEDKALSEAMKENGLGTPATRAAIIETLLSREYIERRGKSLFATEKGMHLIDIVHDHVKSPAMTGEWERRLKNIERGEESLHPFMKDIESFVCEVVGNGNGTAGLPRKTASDPPEPSSITGPPPPYGEAPPPEFEFYDEAPLPTVAPRPSSRGSAAPAVIPVPLRPRSERSLVQGEPLSALLKRAFGFDAFRPHQEAVCRAVTDGKDVLLVMPTGAGKSLCYQLPGIARGGTTLVVSPLIALMDDQTSALRQKGFVAERIHSGLSRDASREVCRRYLRGELDFLFIAPERLGVPGFPEMLAKRMPVLTAVDEAHCISHWGHDFRPDYRMLKDRLGLLRAAPVIAMTATATPIVQNDIAAQLAMPHSARFIHGFRRTNIAVEVQEMPQRARAEATLKLLGDGARRPAIVYAPTRKKAEELAAELAGAFPAAAYHAGMSPAIRERVQNDFISGRLEIIVATIAFGMGIDKANVRTVVHAALPSSIEGYYQEIGRAGRDGLPSKAVLLYAYADVKTHEFFLDRDYPDLAVLTRVYNRLTGRKQTRDQLLASAGVDDETLSTVLEKLWIHGGADVSPDETVSKGTDQWQRPYLDQRRHKESQLNLVVQYAQSTECRMLRLVRHFGDQEDSGETCGCCDVCRPEDSILGTVRSASDGEQRLMTELLDELSLSGTAAKGKLFRDSFEQRLTRNEFETLVEALCRGGFLKVEQDEFMKDGRLIAFQRLHLTAKGYAALSDNRAIRSDIRVSAVTPPKTASVRNRKKKAPGKMPATRGTATRKPAAVTTSKYPSMKLVDELKAWRLALAKKRGIPAFRILTDRVLTAIATERPRDENDLQQISGVGDAILKKFGKQILNICLRYSD